MAPIAGPSITLLMLTAMEHDLTAQLNSKQDLMQMYQMKSIFLGNAKASLLQGMASGVDITRNPQYNAILAQEQMLQALEKTLDMQMTQLQNQLKMVQQRKESAQKQVDEGCKSMKYTMGG